MIADRQDIVLNYTEEAMRTKPDGLFPNNVQLINAALGLAGESGEVADILKKCNFQGHALDKDKLIEELGDILWYVALAAQALGTDVSEIMVRNIQKLWKRYPNGFDSEKSINRGS